MTTFDPARISADTTLSNGNLTATHTGGVAEDSVTPGIGFHSSGQFSFTITVGAITAGHTQLGMAASTTPTGIGTFLGFDTTAFGVQPSGNVTINSVIAGTVGTYVANAAVDFAIDLTGKLFWMRSNGGNWNGSASASPGVSGGFSLASLATFTLSPSVNIYTMGDSAILNPSPNLGIPGFPSWDPATPPLQVVGKVHTVFNSTEVTVQMSGASPSPAIRTEGFPFGTVEMFQSSGTAIATVQPQQSNDGAIWINLGSPLTVPTIQDLYSGVVPSKFVRYLVNGGDNTSVVNIVIEMTGTRD